MRILFVSGTTEGGSGRSQRDLATQLIRRGHAVEFLVHDARAARRTHWAYERLSDLSVRWEPRPGSDLITSLRSKPGRTTSTRLINGLTHHMAALPQNALPTVLRTFRPHAVVASSVERWAWRMIHQQTTQLDVPSVLYVREDDSLTHLDTGALPDLLVANARSLAVRLRARGFDCAFVPSVVDTSPTATESSREVALAINPIPSRGSDLIWQVAARVPEIRIVAQESWPLPGPELAEVKTRIAQLPNVEFRPVAPPSAALYSDARVLLVPYRVDNRPRVIPEALANGIPVIAANVPALVEAIGAGGVTVPIDSVDDWARTIRRLWEDDDQYQLLTDAARKQSRCEDIDPNTVAERFMWLLESAVERAPDG